jgi:cellulose synthase/poly-beta-1,6-N-acetylglucosamine synthase-like glycosyltransferase
MVSFARHSTLSATFGMDAHPRTDRLSLVIPAFNEAQVIAQAVREAEFALSGQFARFEVLVVDDGSTDDTASRVERLLPKARRTQLLRHATNRGYGSALRTGFEAARYDLVAFTDADCQFDLNDLGTLAALAAEYPIVAGYRADRKDSRRRRFFSWGYNTLARLLLGTGLRDVDCALKVFRRDVLAMLLPKSRGFFVNTEMMTCARQLGLAVAEVPVTHRPRAKGTSKVSLREIPRTAAKLLGFWWAEVIWRTQPRAGPGTVLQARVTTAPPPIHPSRSRRAA